MPLVVLSGKVTPEVLAQFRAAQENSESMTFNAFIEEILEAYQNPKTKKIEVPTPTEDQIAEIVKYQEEIDGLKNELQESVNEVGRWKQAYDLEKQEKQALGEESRGLSRQLTEAKTSSLKLEPGQEIITIGPVTSRILDREVAQASKKSGKQWTRGQLLVDTFEMGVEKGQSYPYLVWSKSEIDQVKKEVALESTQAE